MKGIIMNTKKIYITPGINVMNIMTTYIMAGSGSNPGGGHSGLGTEDKEIVTIPDGGGITPSSSGGSDDGPVVQAKNNSFNAWETWEEY
nr:hypothetical protein [uncultured Prevotella sp.]